MTKQKMVYSSTSLRSFWEEMTRYLNNGWKIIPGTVVISVTTTGERHMSTEERCVGFVECDSEYVEKED